MDSKPFVRFLEIIVMDGAATRSKVCSLHRPEKLAQPFKEVVVLNAKGLRVDYGARAEMHPASCGSAAPYSYL